MNPQTKYQPKRRGKEHIHLLQNEDVRRWYENVSRGSIITADVCLRRLGRFCIDYNTTPKKLIKMNEKQLHNFLMDCIADLERKEVGKKESELKQMFRLELLKVAGCSDEEIEKMKIDEMEDDKFKEIVREKLVGKTNNNHKQKIIIVNELNRYLEEGWKFISIIPENRMIIESLS